MWDRMNIVSPDLFLEALRRLSGLKAGQSARSCDPIDLHHDAGGEMDFGIRHDGMVLETLSEQSP